MKDWEEPLSPDRIVEMRLIVDSDGLYPGLYQSRTFLMLAIYQTLSSKKVEKMLIEELQRQSPGYTFKVVILSGSG